MVVKEYGELTLAPLPSNYNRSTGQFFKGHTPHNKCKKWETYLNKKQQKKCAKGWKNLEKYRPTSRPDVVDRCSKQIVCVFDDGEFVVFKSTAEAGRKLNVGQSAISRCCRKNKIGENTKLQRGNPHSNYMYKGMRFYFESDTKWLNKINKKYL